MDLEEFASLPTEYAIKTTKIENRETKREAVYQPLKDDNYHNMTMLSPSGRVLCRCGPKKVNWYLSRGLAKVISEQPLTIQLNFEPAGNGEHGDAYQLSEKHNNCVVCGRDDYNTKHHIVEYEYRQYMPLEYKSHNSYDLMILCGPCHTRYEVEAMKLKSELAKKYNAPMSGTGWYRDGEVMRIKKTATALRKAGHLMPAERVAEYRAFLHAYLKLSDDEEIKDEHFDSIGALEPLVRTSEYKTHGQTVIEHLTTPELLTEFIKMWRKHFIDTMQPQFISELWGIDRGKSELRSMKKGRHGASSNSTSSDSIQENT